MQQAETVTLTDTEQQQRRAIMAESALCKMQIMAAQKRLGELEAEGKAFDAAIDARIALAKAEAPASIAAEAQAA